MGAGQDSKARIWMARISKRTSLFLQGLNETVGPGCWQSPGENKPALPRGTAALGVSFCPKQSSLRTYRGLVCISPALFGVPVIGHYPSYHPLARELRLGV